jgi:CubicO group peptidase (beta-lactamase class C family)
MQIFKTAFLVFFMSIVMPLSRVNADPNKLQSFVETEAKEAGIPGVSYSYISSGEVQFGNFGTTKKKNGKAVTSKTLFSLGSVSKSFTAIAIMQLIEKGALKLDDPVSSHLSEFTGKPVGIITVREMLSHTSGLSTLQGNQHQMNLSIDEDALAKRVSDLLEVTPASKPGTNWAYSNANFQLLSRIVEVLSGQQFEDYIETRVLSPIGMTDSRMIDWKVREGDAVGHRHWFWTKVQYDGRGIGRGSFGQGGVVASARDMAKYLLMMMNGQDDVITSESKAQMMQPASAVSPFYGFGWIIVPDRNMVLHDGQNPGFEAFAVMQPEVQKAFVILGNGSSGFGYGETGYLYKGATVLALGGPEVLNSRITNKGIFFAVIAVPILFLFSIVRTWRKRNNGTTVRKKSQIIFRCLMIVFSLGLAYTLVVTVPASFGANIQTAALYQPDVGILLVAGSLCAAIWASMQIWLLVKQK